MRFAALAGLLLVAGCASIQKEKGHNEVARFVRQRTGFNTGWEQGAPENEQMAQRVAELLASGLNRDRAAQIALLNNRELQSVYEELGVSQAELVQAGLLTNPRLSAAVGFPLKPGNVLEYSGSLVIDFLNVFLLPLRKSVAAEKFAAEVAHVANEALRVVAETSAQFAEVQAAEKLVELQRVSSDGARAAAFLAERQHDAGNNTDLEFAQARVAYSQRRLDLAAAERALVVAREQINEQLGLFGDQTNWTVAEPLAALPPSEPELEGLERRALRQRLDLAARRRNTMLAARMVAVAKTSRLFGVIEVGADIHQDPDGPIVAGPTLTLELPIFDQRVAQIAKLEAEQRQAERQLGAAGIRVRADVRRARARLLIARDMADHYLKSVLPLRERVLSETQLQYNAMQVGLRQLVEARTEQAEAYSGYIRSLAEYWMARAELERAIGGPLEGPVSTEEAGK